MPADSTANSTATPDRRRLPEQLAADVAAARAAAGVALGVAFDQEALVGYGGRSMVYLADTAALKIYTHRPAERAHREIDGLAVAEAAVGIRVPHVLGHDDAVGAVSWVSATRLSGRPPTGAVDGALVLGRVAAALHALPDDATARLAPFGRTLRAVDDDRHPERTALTAALAQLEPAHEPRCTAGFVHGDFSARNLLTTGPCAAPGVIDFEGCGRGCTYEDLTNLYVQNCLLDGWDASAALTAYEQTSTDLGAPRPVATDHLLFHAVRYLRWLLQWAPEVDPVLADRITAVVPAVLDAATSGGPLPR